MYRIMTPGPTEVSENVMQARACRFTNPDLDEEFVEEYRNLCEMISRMLHTGNETLILGGEGILGLEAGIASLTEPGDRVLIIDNGLYGEGNRDFVKIYRGEPVMYSVDRKNPVDPQALEEFLKKDHGFKFATVVHCDTPSGVLNDISVICPLLKKYGILTMVDAVSSTFGEPIDVDACQIDLLCGGSQKAVSAPPGLTFVTVSEDAREAMHTRKTPIASFYANLTAFDHYYEEKWFPYTMPISDIYGFRVAIREIAADQSVYDRHRIIGECFRKAVTDAGLHLHLESGYSNTVTVIDVPEGVSAEDILTRMREKHNIMIAGSMGYLAGKVLRVGHMGFNAKEENMCEVLRALQEVCVHYGVKLEKNMEEVFREARKQYPDYRENRGVMLGI